MNAFGPHATEEVNKPLRASDRVLPNGAARVGEIPESFEDLRKANQALGEILQRLASRLGPILRKDQQPANPSGIEETRYVTDLAMSICVQRRLLVGYYEGVEELIDRLEI